MCSIITPDLFEGSDDPLKLFTETVYDIASACIPKSTPTAKKPEKPWYNEECKKAVKERKKALKKFKKQPTQYNLQLYRIKRAKARQVIRINKKKSWKEYVSKLNNRTPMKKCWDMIRKISGKRGGMKVHHLSKHGATIMHAIFLALDHVETSEGSHFQTQSLYCKHCRVKTGKIH